MSVAFHKCSSHGQKTFLQVIRSPDNKLEIEIQTYDAEKDEFLEGVTSFLSADEARALASIILIIADEIDARSEANQ